MRILHLSDLHFGYEDGESLAVIYKLVNAAPIDLIIASGDLSAAGLQTELSACADWLASLGPPVMAVPGNHDAPYFEFFPRFYRPFRRFRAAAQGRMARDWVSGEVCVVGINTARGWQMRLNWALGSISPAQTARAVGVLRRAAPGAVKIVVTHHPLIWPRDPALPGATHGGITAAKALVRAGAHLFLAGHLHVMRDTPFSEDGRQALAVTGGTLCTRLRGDPQGFNVIDVSEGAVRIERYGIENGEANLRSVRASKMEAGRLIVDETAPPNPIANVNA